MKAGFVGAPRWGLITFLPHLAVIFLVHPRSDTPDRSLLATGGLTADSAVTVP